MIVSDGLDAANTSKKIMRVSWVERTGAFD